jgi:hypothetical protein
MTTRTVRTRPKYLRILLFMLFVVFAMGFGLFTGYGLILIFLSLFEDYYLSILFLIPLCFSLSLIFVPIKLFGNKVNYAIANDEGLKIIYPFKFKTISLKWNEIKGYSKSDYWYGGRPGFNSKSIVIYSKSRHIFEIIKVYNLDFQNFQTKIRQFDVVCFGSEKFIKKPYLLISQKRFYKYDEMFNESGS